MVTEKEFEALVKDLKVSKWAEHLKSFFPDENAAMGQAIKLLDLFRSIALDVDFTLLSKQHSFETVLDYLNTNENYWGGVVSSLGQTIIEAQLSNIDTMHDDSVLAKSLNGLQAFFEEQILLIPEGERLEHHYWIIHRKIFEKYPIKFLSSGIEAPIRKHKEEYKQLETKLDALNKATEALDQKNTGLQDTLKNLSSKYNFVGLHTGFQKVYENKEAELKSTKKFMFILGMAILGAATYMGYNISSGYEISSMATHEVASLIKSKGITVEQAKELFEGRINSAPTMLGVLKHATFFTIEIILIYFFRITIKSFFSIKGQMIQLDLRKSLCVFVHNYPAFKQDNPGIELEAFEKLIFSGITADEGKIPTTFDGLNDLASLIASIKPK